MSAKARFSEVASPAPKVTAAAPNTIATIVTTVRVGRENGAVSPSVTARGRPLNRASDRCAAYPRAGRGARPVAIACTALIRPARNAGGMAPAAVSARTASGTVTSTQNGTPSRPTS